MAPVFIELTRGQLAVVVAVVVIVAVAMIVVVAVILMMTTILVVIVMAGFVAMLLNTLVSPALGRAFALAAFH